MKKTAWFLLLTGVLTGPLAKSQSSDEQLTNLLKLDLGLQGIGFSYETPLSKSLTAELATGIGGGYEIDDTWLTYRLDFFKPAFYFSLTSKYYYNQSGRAARQRKTALNSGNYIGFRARYVTPEAGGGITVNSLLTNIHWGMQRAIGRRWTFNLHAGVGYARDVGASSTFNRGTFYPALDVRAAYIFLRSESQ